MPKLGESKKIHAKWSSIYVLPDIKSKAGHCLKWLRLFDNPNHRMTRIRKDQYLVIDYKDENNKLKVSISVAAKRLEFIMRQGGYNGFQFTRLSLPDRQFMILALKIFDPRNY